MRFPIKYDTFGGIVLRMVLCPQSQARVDIDGDTVHVRLGWAFRATFRAADVEAVERARDVLLTRGAHGWMGSWLVNGASGPIVRLRLSTRRRAWVAGFPIRLRELRVSVADPDALIAAFPSCRPAEGSARIS